LRIREIYLFIGYSKDGMKMRENLILKSERRRWKSLKSSENRDRSLNLIELRKIEGIMLDEIFFCSFRKYKIEQIF